MKKRAEISQTPVNYDITKCYNLITSSQTEDLSIFKKTLSNYETRVIEKTLNTTSESGQFPLLTSLIMQPNRVSDEALFILLKRTSNDFLLEYLHSLELLHLSFFVDTDRYQCLAHIISIIPENELYKTLSKNITDANKAILIPLDMIDTKVKLNTLQDLVLRLAVKASRYTGQKKVLQDSRDGCTEVFNQLMKKLLLKPNLCSLIDLIFNQNKAKPVVSNSSLSLIENSPTSIKITWDVILKNNQNEYHSKPHTLNVHSKLVVLANDYLKDENYNLPKIIKLLTLEAYCLVHPLISHTIDIPLNEFIYTNHVRMTSPENVFKFLESHIEDFQNALIATPASEVNQWLRQRQHLKYYKENPDLPLVTIRHIKQSRNISIMDQILSNSSDYPKLSALIIKYIASTIDNERTENYAGWVTHVEKETSIKVGESKKLIEVKVPLWQSVHHTSFTGGYVCPNWSPYILHHPGLVSYTLNDSISATSETAEYSKKILVHKAFISDVIKSCVSWINLDHWVNNELYFPILNEFARSIPLSACHLATMYMSGHYPFLLRWLIIRHKSKDFKHQFFTSLPYDQYENILLNSEDPRYCSRYYKHSKEFLCTLIDSIVEMTKKLT